MDSGDASLRLHETNVPKTAMATAIPPTHRAIPRIFACRSTRHILSAQFEMKSGLAQRSAEAGLAALVAVVIILMVVPVPPPALDLLIALNIAISVLVFSLSLYVRRPLRFSVFPTLLLLATLYRLSLNVASTRAILTRADAGRIISGFGSFAAGGDIIVGAVIFGIILMVLFLVITKGAERVAEVSARFTLDAMPGLQAAIETDLRSRAISPRELSRRREDLERRSMYYGALDGAMKFVRGDAVAALVITVINIAGGTAVGVLRRGMSMGDALGLYGRLTIGDGLVTMIPALLISTAAGILVTRLGQGDTEGRLGVRIGEQLGQERGALVAAAVLLLLLGLIPGLPLWPFLLLSAALGGLAFARRRGRALPEQRAPMDGVDIGLDDMQEQLDAVAVTHPVLVREAVYGRISLSELADVVGELRGDGLGPPVLPHILEALARDPVGGDPDERMARLRLRLQGPIGEAVAPGGVVRAAAFDEESEDILSAALESSHLGKVLVLPPELSRSLRDALAHLYLATDVRVLFTRPELRRPLARFARALPAPAILAHGELDDAIRVELVDDVTLEDARGAA